ncbi:hypothetical protein E2562_026119 [Oryza meyeriana var. granulata]|uniref:Uncharacterized protein n=1 Tax=Oryza meyeriana var. granulata TaxID=110450 RepID=A0A6G1C0W1_9ORYZ|nr:hypothetical protein E2562_026119 [Oryza meyeriana var. granulata]
MSAMETKPETQREVTGKSPGDALHGFRDEEEDICCLLTRSKRKTRRTRKNGINPTTTMVLQEGRRPDPSPSLH